MTSSALRSIAFTRHGSFFTCTSPTPATSRMSISRSEFGVAQHRSAMPRVFSSFDSADDECERCSTSPLTTVPLHEPHAPFLQPYGRPMPWRRAAVTPPRAARPAGRPPRSAGAAPAPPRLPPPPPQKTGDGDRRTRALLATLSSRRIRPARGVVAPVARLRRARTTWMEQEATNIVPDRGVRLARSRAPLRIVYASTTGVYGDCGGALIDETRPVRPANDRAKRRVSAEQQLRRAAARGAVAAAIARIPGIYAANRLPPSRLEKRTPALIAADAVYTRHIQA